MKGDTIKCNINDKVYVRLTDDGINILNELNKRLRESFSNLQYSLPKEKDGWYEFSMLELMNIFGVYMYRGNPYLPFETEILIDVSKCD